MDYSKNYSSIWRVYKVNRETWADGDLVDNIDSVSISREAESKLVESGSMEVTGEFTQDYYRVVMTAEQDGSIERVDVATLLFNVAGGEINFGTTINKVSGYSVLYPAKTKSVTSGKFASAGINGAEYAAELLEDAINAPIEVEGSFKLNEHIVHEIGSSVIDAVWEVLKAGGFILQIDGRGIVHIKPKPAEADLIISDETMRLLSNGIKYDKDESEIPNRYVVIQDNAVVIASNNDRLSPMSIRNRGYTVDIVDTSPTPVNGETLNGYAERKLHEASILSDVRTYTREYAPNVYPFSIVKCSIDGTLGDYRVMSQSIACGNGITFNEKAVMEVNLWEA